ncbi:hypothetical protein PspLS_03940 [Pyricularia sp. CBS 133598]|nr:hypothetical protein PspLS_03940 [Pyricularia sp. CBS 133598]
MLPVFFILNFLFSTLVLGGETHENNGVQYEIVSIGSYFSPALFSELKTFHPDHVGEERDVVILASTTARVMYELQTARRFKRSYIYVVDTADKTFYTPFSRWMTRGYYGVGYDPSASWFARSVPIKWSSVVGVYATHS